LRIKFLCQLSLEKEAIIMTVYNTQLVSALC